MSIRVLEATPENMATVRDLFEEYAASLSFDLGFQNFAAELASLPGDYSLPHGCLLLAWSRGDAVGCVGLRPLGQTTCEMKRLYVQPREQRIGVGRALVEAVIAQAKIRGYRAIRLDTVPGMDSAMRLYLSLGFQSIAPYRENPVEGAAYFEKLLE